MADTRSHGFRAAVTKPYRIEDFSRTLDEVIRGRRS
jgi:hypothetical protein